uniref:Uncharacterized protein n=1 Tax=Acrobeloides nanus TaxID=290746 RepID=A0A914C5B7_9BILA
MTRGKNRKAVSLTDLRSSENASKIKEDGECLLWDLEQSTQSQSTTTINIINETSLLHSIPTCENTQNFFNTETVVSIPRSCCATRFRTHMTPRSISKFSIGRIHKKPHVVHNSKSVVHEFKMTPTVFRNSSKHSRMVSRACFYISNNFHRRNSYDEYVVSVSSPLSAQTSLVIAPMSRPRFMNSTVRFRPMRPKTIPNFGSLYEESEERSASEPPTSSSCSEINSLDFSCLSFDGFRSDFDAALGSFNELSIDINGNDLNNFESQQIVQPFSFP